MATYTTLEAEARPLAGKGPARATRRAGKVPGIIYGAKQTPTLISIEPKVVLREIQSNGWRSRLFEIKVDGTEPTRALIRDVQMHPVTDRPEHVDFQRLAPGERIRVAVAVHFTGEATSPGLKRGGVLNVVRHTIECFCDPDLVPPAFEADLSDRDINDNVRWHDLKGTDNVRPTVERDFVVATVAAPTKGAEPVVDPNAAAAAAPAAAGKGGKGAAPAKAAAPKKGAAAPAAKAAPKAPAAKK